MLIPSKEHFAGCLIGQCLGDALGFPVEGYPRSVCSRYVEELKAGTSPQGRYPFPFGQYTDDSQLARELIISIVERGEFDPARYADRIREMFSHHRVVGGGRATTQAALRLAQGVPWEKSGTPSPSAGNGSAMRAGPIGLFFFDDPDALTSAAHDQGRITHTDSRCSAGAVAIACSVAQALQGDPIVPHRFLGTISNLAKKIDPSVAQAVEYLEGCFDLEPRNAFETLARKGYVPENSDDWQGITPFVTGSVMWSIYAFLKNSFSYVDTIHTAIAVGGDVDTTSAMAGAISGAYLGLEAIPPALAEHITDQGEWRIHELKNLAYSLYDLKVRSLA